MLLARPRPVKGRGGFYRHPHSSSSLLPVEFEGKPCNGFDDTEETKWQSAPEDGEIRTVYFSWVPHNDMYEFRTADETVATVTDRLIENGRIPLQIRGKKKGETELQAVLKETGEIVASIMIDVLPRIEKTVTAWKITNATKTVFHTDNGGTVTGYSESLDPGEIPSEDQIQTYLDNHLGRVANIHFTVNVENSIAHYDRSIPGHDPNLLMSTDEAPYVRLGFPEDNIDNVADTDHNVYIVKRLYSENHQRAGYTFVGSGLQCVSTHSPNSGESFSIQTIIEIITHELCHGLGRNGHTDTSDKGTIMYPNIGGSGCEIRRDDWRAMHEHQSR